MTVITETQKGLAFKTVEWTGNSVRMIDQRALPGKEVYKVYRDHKGVAKAITDMVVRGAPAIGVAAGYGAALGAMKLASKTTKTGEFLKNFDRVLKDLAGARPTAVNLFWAVERMRRTARDNNGGKPAEIAKRLVEEAIEIHVEDDRMCDAIGRHGAKLFKSGDNILTHCNAGALATGGSGTALGVIRGAVNMGKKITVYADETRPFLQGARLTAWELMKDKIPVVLITDNMAGHFMKKGVIDRIIVGSDRIAANGDVCNKIGTYSVAVLAAENNIPFYVAAPTSTIDMNCPNGDLIPIEERPIIEVTHMGGKRIASKNIKVRNPAFDVTPAKFVKAIITEKGIVRAPYKSSIKKLFRK